MAPSFDCCIKVSYHQGKPVGEESKLAEYDTYVTGEKTADKAILIIPDVHGKTLVNTRVLADKYAQAIGARVYLPDLFDGKDLVKLCEANPGKERGELIKELISEHNPRTKWEKLPPLVEAIKAAQPSVKKIGAIGFCWGATGCLYLGSKKAGASQVDAIAFAHPSLIEAEDFDMLDRPGLFMTCENDYMFPKEKQEASKLVVEKRAKEGVFSRFSYYPFVSHGWSLKGDETDPYSAKAMAHAATEAIGFFSLELA